MNYWVISDTHFGHRNMEKLCGRPSNFEFLILDNLSKAVKPNDVVIHLGDVCFGNDATWHENFKEACNGAKTWLVLGNHDKKSMSWYLTHGWNVVCKSLEMELYGETLLFTHRPMERAYKFINVHGHLHRSVPNEKFYRSIYMEHHYKPQLLRDIVENKCLKD